MAHGMSFLLKNSKAVASFVCLGKPIMSLAMSPVDQPQDSVTSHGCGCGWSTLDWLAACLCVISAPVAPLEESHNKMRTNNMAELSTRPPASSEQHESFDSQVRALERTLKEQELPNKESLNMKITWLQNAIKSNDVDGQWQNWAINEVECLYGKHVSAKLEWTEHTSVSFDERQPSNGEALEFALQKFASGTANKDFLRKSAVRICNNLSCTILTPSFSSSGITLAVADVFRVWQRTDALDAIRNPPVKGFLHPSVAQPSSDTPGSEGRVGVPATSPQDEKKTVLTISSSAAPSQAHIAHGESTTAEENCSASAKTDLEMPQVATSQVPPMNDELTASLSDTMINSGLCGSHRSHHGTHDTKTGKVVPEATSPSAAVPTLEDDKTQRKLKELVMKQLTDKLQEIQSEETRLMLLLNPDTPHQMRTLLPVKQQLTSAARTLRHNMDHGVQPEKKDDHFRLLCRIDKTLKEARLVSETFETNPIDRIENPGLFAKRERRDKLQAIERLLQESQQENSKFVHAMWQEVGETQLTNALIDERVRDDINDDNAKITEIEENIERYTILVDEFRISEIELARLDSLLEASPLQSGLALSSNKTTQDIRATLQTVQLDNRSENIESSFRTSINDSIQTLTQKIDPTHSVQQAMQDRFEQYHPASLKHSLASTWKKLVERPVASPEQRTTGKGSAGKNGQPDVMFWS